MLRRWNRSAFERSVSVASPLVLLMVWELAARATLIDTRFFPAPSSIVQTLWQMLQPSPLFPTGELQTHLGISLLRIAVGFLLGSATGITLGILMGLLPIARAVVQPLVDATFPVPKVAILPLFIMLFGIGEASK